MHATTVAEFGNWVRWIHLPAFFIFLGLLLFVYFYLGTGRPWLLSIVIAARSFILIRNFAVHPNFTFREITTLRHVSVLGEQISVPGASVAGSWQWVAAASNVLLIVFMIDAVIQRWLKGDPESRRKALVIGLAIAGPMVLNCVLAQLVAFGALHVPLPSMPYLGSVIVIVYELSREARESSRAQARLRNELARAERVNVLGHLAAALAHEISQPLAASLINAEAALQELESQTPDFQGLHAIVTDIRDQDTRAAKTISRLRALIQQHGVQKESLSVSEVVQDVLSLVHSEAASKEIALDSIIRPGLPRVWGDRVHLSQVLLNLLVNAVEAVQSRPEKDRRILVEARENAESGKVELAVHDSGCGIPQGDIDSVFKPFFSTKSDGIGIGLALSRTIVEAHGGSLWAENRTIGDGATFRFTLRRA
jgi:signal transduction histidine kinase